MTAQVCRRLFTVEEYFRMAEVGILDPDERVELINGEIVEMSPIGTRHNACVDRAAHQFFSRLSGRAIIRTQGSVRLGPQSEPEPDLVLLRPRADFYASTPATPADILLIVEVADSTIVTDREVKVPLYAAAEVPEVWLEDLGAQLLRVYREPVAGEYRQTLVLGYEASIAPLAFPDVTFTVAELLG